jgi:hypothetical protein
MKPEHISTVEIRNIIRYSGTKQLIAYQAIRFNFEITQSTQSSQSASRHNQTAQ